MLIVTYDPTMVVASLVIAIMASFTGLRLASGLSRLPLSVRKQEIAKAAIALGGGIWSMHFVGMLAVQIPVHIFYDALPTLGSVLVAILLTGAALILLHFGGRSRLRIVTAGGLVGLGIVAMHFIGMSGVSGNCVTRFDPAAYLASGTIALGASTIAIWVAYRRRALPSVVAGGVMLGLTVAAMHYTAMIFTRFERTEETFILAEPTLSQGALALIVSFVAFLICGIFLLTAVPARLASTEELGKAGSADTEAKPTPAALEAEAAPGQLPYKENHATRFIAKSAVHAIRADGHYTWLSDGTAEHFCPWPISRVAEALDESFLRTHRSFLVNRAYIQGFERDGDKAWCLVGTAGNRRIPVSRSRRREVRDALGLT